MTTSFVCWLRYARTVDEDLVGGQWGGTVTWFAIIAVVVVLVLLFAIAG